MRITLTGGCHPNEEYLRHVGINGIGDNASDHNQLLIVGIHSKLLRETGFEPVYIVRV